MKKIAFHTNQLCLRGSEIALYLYADYNERILGNKSYILSDPNRNLDALDKFKARFEVKLSNFHDHRPFLKENNVDYLYCIKAGGNDGVCMEEPPTLVHAVFCSKEVHGHRYAYVSDWLCRHMGFDVEKHSIPHIVEPLPLSPYSLREKLGISSNKRVFGCYAGFTEFNISWVQELICNLAAENPDIVFLFMNIEDFRFRWPNAPATQHNNIIFLPGTWDLQEKSAFVNACDAMIHARGGGETFGCAVAEFATANKPVLTYGDSGERSHIELLGERGIFYYNGDQLKDMFLNLPAYIKHDDYYKAYECCKPEIIMERFKKVYLD
jgi:hypothetical protein